MGIIDRLSRRFRPVEAKAADSSSANGVYRGASTYVDGLQGLVNAVSGLGTSHDGSRAAGYYRTEYSTRHRLDTLFAESPFMAKAISIPAVDMTIRWRTWDRDGESMREAEQEFGTRELVRQLVTAGRLYGTALAIILDGDSPDQELDPGRAASLDDLNVPIVDRYQVSIDSWIASPQDKDFGRPAMYYWSPEFTATGGDRDGTVQIPVHPSRVLRYDGISLPVASPHAYQSWGISVANHVLRAVLQEEQGSAAAAHLAEHASIPIYRGEYGAAMMGQEGLQTAKQLAAEVASQMSVWRAIFVDKAVDVERLQVTFAGLDAILDRAQIRVAAAADIPVTRFWGRSPAGMNATGESDVANYAQLIAEKQESMRSQLAVLDEVVASAAGVGVVPEYDWASLVEISDEKRATTAKTKAEALKIGLDAYALDEDEMRAALDGDDVFGDLEGPAPEAPEPDPMEAMPFGGAPEEDAQAAQPAVPPAGGEDE